MKPSLAHLDPATQAAMQLPTRERIDFAQQDHWIGYSRAQRILAAMENLPSHPKALRMPNLLLVGDSGNGKSTIVEQFWSRHPVREEPSGNPFAPVIAVEMPPEPNEGRFWSAVLDVLMIPHREKDPVQSKASQAIAVLAHCQTKMLVSDEIHHTQYGNVRQQRQFLAVLKNLNNRLKMPMVAVGTMEAVSTMRTDPQMGSRFEALSLPRWRLDGEFLRLLATLERLLPLAEPSGFASRELAIKLHTISGGLIGGMIRVLKRAAGEAIRSGTERIDSTLLDQVAWENLSEVKLSSKSA